MADYEDTKVSNLIINNMSQEKFDELAAAGELDPTQVYLTPTEAEGGASLPDQTDNAGKFLMTDGATPSWSDKPLVNISTKSGSIKVSPEDTRGYDYTNSVCIGFKTGGFYSSVHIGYDAVDASTGGYSVGIGAGTRTYNNAVAIGFAAEARGTSSVAIGNRAYVEAESAILISTTASQAKNNDANTFKVATQNGIFEIMSADGNVPRERLKNLVEVLPTADNGYTTVKNFGNGYVEITGYASIGTVGAGTGSEIQVDLPAGYTMADTNYWVNIAPTSETTMFDLKAEAKARSTTHFMVAYKNEDAVTGLTNAGVYWEIRGMLATE